MLMINVNQKWLEMLMINVINVNQNDEKIQLEWRDTSSG
jgi:hypothetical protein